MNQRFRPLTCFFTLAMLAALSGDATALARPKQTQQAKKAHEATGARHHKKAVLRKPGHVADAKAAPRKSAPSGDRESAAAAMRQINRIWLDGQVEDIATMVHSEIVMVVPGFIGRIQGREEFLEGVIANSRSGWSTFQPPDSSLFEEKDRRTGTRVPQSGPFFLHRRGNLHSGHGQFCRTVLLGGQGS